MEVFESHVTERAEWALPIDSKKFEELWKLADLGAPAGDRWTPFEVEIMRKQGGRAFKESDCPSIGSGFLVLRPAAVEVFSPFLGGDAELLDLHCADADLKLLNVWRHLDALDLSNSDVVRFPSSGRIMRVKSYAFDDAAIEGHDMFRLSAMPRAAVFFRKPVVDAVERAGLRRVTFRLLSKPNAVEVHSPPGRGPLTPADIEGASDEDAWETLYKALIPLVTGSRDEQYATVKSWTDGLQMLWATQLVDDEVNNGGFNQFFFNDSGQFANEAIRGFELIGAHERADIVRRAVAQLFKDAPRLRTFYEPRTMEAFMESYKHTDLAEIDEEWSRAPEFFTLRMRYIREHPEEFATVARH